MVLEDYETALTWATIYAEVLGGNVNSDNVV
jgi:3-oxoacyl-(acyl-carrier-protein) synthase